MLGGVREDGSAASRRVVEEAEVALSAIGGGAALFDGLVDAAVRSMGGGGVRFLAIIFGGSSDNGGVGGTDGRETGVAAPDPAGEVVDRPPCA